MNNKFIKVNMTLEKDSDVVIETRLPIEFLRLLYSKQNVSWSFELPELEVEEIDLDRVAVPA